MKKCKRCGRTEEDSVIHRFLYPYVLCTECLDDVMPRLQRELAFFCLERQEGLRITQFKTYLKEKGWKKLTIKSTEVERFESPTTKYVTIDIPAHRGLADPTCILKIALEVLSFYEGRDVGEIMNDICV